MGDLAVRAENLSKVYRLGKSQHDSLSELLAHWIGRVFRPRWPDNLHAQKSRNFWALRDVSFEVKRGEIIGVIGRNGAGKSTLLKILSRITHPTSGRVEIYGRIGSLLEVGTGFHPELTGRENVYLSGAILGMKKTEIDRKFDEIIEFAEVEKFLDVPVKRYSSGMYVRLAFAVAAHLEPEILIIDEVLSVGDMAFQKKCLGEMDSAREQGRTVIVVSHNLGTIENLCQRVILMDKGSIELDGAPESVIDRYLTTTLTVSDVSLAQRKDRAGRGEIIVKAIEYRDENQGLIQHPMTGQELRVRVHYHSRVEKVFWNCRVTVSIYREDRLCIVLSTNLVDRTPLNLCGDGYVDFIVPELPLFGGNYYLNAAIEGTSECQDWIQQAANLTIVDGDFYGTGKLFAHDGYRGHGMPVRHRWEAVQISQGETS